MTDPQPIERLIQEERWRSGALPHPMRPEPLPPSDETSIERFQRELREAAERERRDEALVRRVEHEHPDAPLERDLADPLRQLARAQQRDRVWRRRMRWR